MKARAVSPSGEPTILKVNGTPRHLSVEPWTTLLDALREALGLTGAKKGCDHGQCGACTVSRIEWISSADRSPYLPR